MATIRKNKFEILFFVIGLVLSVLMLKTLRLHTDNTQLMDKSLRLLQEGEWTHFGNVATKVGSIPGSFLTLITTVPMAFYFSAWAAGFSVIIFHVGGYYFCRKSLLHIFENNTSTLSQSLIFLSVLFWLNPWRVEQVELYNPGFLFLFAGIHLYTSLKMVEKNFWLTFWHVLAVGFCFQVHFSFLVLALASLFLFLRKQIRVSWWGFTAGTVIVLASLVPFVLARFISAELLAEQQMQTLDFSKSDAFFGRNLVLVYPVLKATLYFFRMGSTYFGRHIFSEINFDWIDNYYLKNVFDYGFHSIKYIITLVTIGLSFYLIGTFLKSQFQQKIWLQKTIWFEPKNRFLFYFFSLFCAAVIASALSPVEFNHWHLVICFPTISLFMITGLLRYERVQRHFQKIFLVCGTVFVVWNIFSAGGSRSHEFALNYADQFHEHYKIKYQNLDDRLNSCILCEKLKVSFSKNE